MLAEPSRTLVVPLVARVCPEPISSTLNTGNAVSNQTGRDDDVVTLTAAQVCQHAGVDPDQIAIAARGVYDWYVNALRADGAL